MLIQNCGRLDSNFVEFSVTEVPVSIIRIVMFRLGTWAK